MWFRCGMINGFTFERWEVNSDGEVRKYSTQSLVNGSPVPGGYIQMQAGYKDGEVWKVETICKHNLILETFKPRPLEYLECDHRNACTYFNALVNLRWVTKPLNSLYKASRGYTQRGNNWESQLNSISLGTFDNEKDARQAYLIAKSFSIVEKSEELISILISRHGYERAGAIDALNWTEADLDFDAIFEFFAQQ